ncbi:hypothetical protein [Methylobacterium hispanicum]|uniref:hypothetical protein n=1 Tax=Methylobacterium hispanicum TaxID=270350 RepID=UPI002F306E0D
MILSPFDPAELAPVAALIPPRTPEPPVARTTEQFAAACRFASLGLRLPMRPGSGVLHAVVDADEHVVAVLIPSGSAVTDRDRAAAFADALNVSAGFASVRPVPPVAAAE